LFQNGTCPDCLLYHCRVCRRVVPFYANQLKRIHPVPFLSSYARFILFVCLLAVYYLLSIYFHVNLLGPSPSFSVILKFYTIVRSLIFFSVVAGLVLFFIRSVWQLIQRSVNRLFWHLFVASLVVFVFSYGIGAALFFKDNNYEWMLSTQSVLRVWKMVMPLAAMIFLFRYGLGLQDPARKKMTNIFITFYSLGFILLYATIKIPVSKIVGGSLQIFVLFLFGIFPIFWLIRYFQSGAILSEISVASNNVLDEIEEKYNLSKRKGGYGPHSQRAEQQGDYASSFSFARNSKKSHVQPISKIRR